MKNQPTLFSFDRVEWRTRALALLRASRRRPIRKTLTSGILATFLLLLGTLSANADPITWHWAGPVTGYLCAAGGPCPITLDTSVPLGTTVDVFVTLNLNPVGAPSNPVIPCLRGTASASLQVLGRTYTNQGVVWDEGHGFGPGICVPGYDFVEVVVPIWGEDGPSLPNGWVPISYLFFPGLWWPGDLTNVQPLSISSQFPAFHQPGLSSPQRFTANLEAVPVPEPATWLLLSTGLAVAARRRRRRESRIPARDGSAASTVAR